MPAWAICGIPLCLVLVVFASSVGTVLHLFELLHMAELMVCMKWRRDDLMPGAESVSAAASGRANGVHVKAS